MPGKKEYQLSLGEKFPGGRKNWESFNGIIVNKMMDQGLAIFMDISICLFMYMQTSLTECQTEPSASGSPTTPGMTPKTRRRLGRELNKLASSRTEPTITSSEATAETGGPSSRVEIPTAPAFTDPLLPDHLTDPAFEEHWVWACSMGDINYLDDLDMESTILLADNKKDFNDLAAMRATDDMHLKKRQSSLLVQILRTIVRQFINSMVEAFIRPGVNSPEQDFLRSILLSKEMEDVAMGKIFSIEWVKKPWLMPMVRVYVQLLHYFENLNEQGTVNLVQELMDVLKSASTSSVTDIALQFDCVIDPIARTFNSVDSFIDYLKASLQLEVIRQRIKQKGSCGRAWRKAHDYLREYITWGKRLDLALIEDAVKLSDAHLRDAGITGIPTEEETKALAAEAAPKPDTPGKKGGKSWKDLRQERKAKDLHAQAAGRDHGKTPPASPHAKGSAPAREMPPICGKCHNRHHCKCLAERVKEQEEMLAATKAKLKKQNDFHCKRKEQAAAQAARVLPEVDDVNSMSDDNESLDAYPRVSDWNPDLPPPTSPSRHNQCAFASLLT